MVLADATPDNRVDAIGSSLMCFPTELRATSASVISDRKQHIKAAWRARKLSMKRKGGANSVTEARDQVDVMNDASASASTL